MSSAGSLTPNSQDQRLTVSAGRRHLRPLASLTASAQRITSRSFVRGSKVAAATDWQADCWAMYDVVGEQHFLATTIANRISQGRLYVGRLTDNSLDDPEQVDDPRFLDILNAIGDSPTQREQIVQRLAINLFMTGDGWLVGIPKWLLPVSLRKPQDVDLTAPPRERLNAVLDDRGEGVESGPPPLDIESLEWQMLSVSELRPLENSRIRLLLGESSTEHIEVSPDEVYLIRVWRSHPRFKWEADCPTRASLPILRELAGLTMGISAQIDSRLAGAGVFLVPASAQQSLEQTLRRNADTDELEVDPDSPDVLTDAMMEAMLTPIQDRSSAAAIVPLTLTVPDESIEKFRHITFSTPFDAEARSLREEAIRRLALGQDAPPELLLGTAGMNHWGAWLVREDVVTTHIEPPLALICDALTSQYLWPVLMEQGMSEEEVQQYVIWYDVSHMVIRPDQSGDAKDLNRAGVLSNAALLAAAGFDESDGTILTTLDPEMIYALRLVETNPGLIVDPGLPKVVAQVRALMKNDIPDYEEPKPPEPGPVPPGLEKGGAVPPEAPAEPTAEGPPAGGPDTTTPAVGEGAPA